MFGSLDEPGQSLGDKGLEDIALKIMSLSHLLFDYKIKIENCFCNPIGLNPIGLL